MKSVIILLADLEWSATVNTETMQVQICPSCCGWNPATSFSDEFWNGREFRKGHKSNCELSKMLYATSSPNPMPTKLEDIATPRCKSFKRFNALLISESSGLLGGVTGEHWSSHPSHYERTQLIRLEDAETLEIELHVAREERDDALTHERDAQKGAKTNAEVARRLAASNCELRLELEKANQKCQLVDDMVLALEHLHSCIDLCKGHGTPIIKNRDICYLAMMETEQALSKAAKTL